jgi:hypothetical protein
VRPGDESGAGGKGEGHMRASRTDRDRVVDVLKGAFIQERLAEGELDDRIGRALAARTWDELDALIADIPAGPHLARPPAPAPWGVAGPVPAGPGPAQPPPAAQASLRPESLIQDEPVSRSMKAVVAGMGMVIVMSGVTTGVVAGPGPGVVIACLVAGAVFVTLWVIACYGVVRERPRR